MFIKQEAEKTVEDNTFVVNEADEASRTLVVYKGPMAEKPTGSDNASY